MDNEWNLEPAWRSLNAMIDGLIGAAPLIITSIIILALFGVLSYFATRYSKQWLRKKIPVPLLRILTARAIGLVVFVLGMLVMFQVAGLTGFALGLIGGTSLVGVVLGIAFRGISENFLTSIFLSMQDPFRTGDLVQIGDAMGYVQEMTTRVTILTTLDGFQVQIPNSTVYNTEAYNYSVHVNRRESFVINITYSQSIPKAQEVALQVLEDHPAVLKNPEPWVLVDDFGPSAVRMRIYFWMNGQKHSWLKVRSSVMRMIKTEFQRQDIAIPDVERELIFPRGIDVRMLEASDKPTPETPQPQSRAEERAEGGFESESQTFIEQARLARPRHDA